jgi:predicted DNA-binding antitoxin AbrB/MazE fold protein
MARARAKTVKRNVRARVRGATLELLEPVALREGEEVVVTLSESAHKPDLDALRRAAGGWKGNVDADALIKMIYASRLVKSKRPIPRF